MIDIEKKYQKIWEDDKVFEMDAPERPENMTSAELREKYPKFFGTMAYPYMNGVLHAGHCFTLSKVEFAMGYERLMGKNALFPLGFHCTGMPIKASADKLVREIELFGKDFAKLPKDEEPEPEVEKPKAAKLDVEKFGSKKSKAVAKQGRAKYQFEIMEQLGIPREEIQNFSDPNYWLTYFPPHCQADCKMFGAKVDWRRSFITTDVNPYYDSFVRWQMNRLHDLGKIKFGERYTIYSAKDGQPCMDHDRASGEGVGPQEYTGIKIQVEEFPEAAKNTLTNVNLKGKKVFLVAATLRPETMYGQSCCFVSPKITYGLFDAGNDEYFICTERAFKNMCFQKLTPKRGDWSSVAQISGADLIGAKINAPLTVLKNLRVLPMETVLANKGTGVVTCVPSDSPDDYITTIDLHNKPEYYKIEKDWVNVEPVAIMQTPSYGELTAKTLVEEFKIRSPKDKDLLAKAKELAYKEGFYQGVMVIGPYKGEKVEVAKPKVKADLIKSGEAFVYNEPEGVVMSRSGDDCIVSLEDQWFTDYGEEKWKADAEKCLDNMNLYSPENRNAFQKVLDWLRNWALSRSYGLGTKIPWDPKYLVESLSDSTIYMAFQAVAHLLQGDFYGKVPGLLGLKPEEITGEVWDYVFLHKDNAKTDIPKEKLNKLRNEFEYFYPLDVNISGKDLIGNHLTFFIYCHCAIFPEEFWPAGIRSNGHLLLNNEKMSKSTGNFMTLREVVEKFGADASRIALADAGDSLEDANFDETNANAAILRLFNLKEWSEEVLKNSDSLRSGPKDTFFDKAFDNEINQLIEETQKAYEHAFYKGALKTGLFDLQSSRDYYRDSCATSGVSMHKDLVKRYIEVQALLLAPIAPHFCDYLWREVLGHKSTVQNASFPKITQPIDRSLSASLEYLRDTQRSIREVEGANLKKKKGKGPVFDPKKPSKLTLYVAESFPEWQEGYIDLVRDSFQNMSLDFTPEFRQKVSKLGDVKRGMQFVNHLKMRLTQNGESSDTVFNRKLLFDEVKTLESVFSVLEKAPAATLIEKVQVVLINPKEPTKGKDVISGESVDVPTGKAISDAVPGNPGITIVNL